MKKLLLILLCLPMIGFGQTVDSTLLRKLQIEIEKNYIDLAAHQGYKLIVNDSQFICECVFDSIQGWWYNSSNVFCYHDFARYHLYYPEIPIKVQDLDNDGVDDYIINYTLEPGLFQGQGWINYDATILGGDKLRLIHNDEIYSNVKSIGEILDKFRGND